MKMYDNQIYNLSLVGHYSEFIKIPKYISKFQDLTTYYYHMRHSFYLAEIPPMPLRHLNWMCGVARCSNKSAERVDGKKLNCEVVMSRNTTRSDRTEAPKKHD
ncbi:hypothetical protein NQ317_001838 [Molorchus minor]|uniref:Uncharacterized protein n=1 Tax=Molorchus minor TaxID=1323400 RepID=A0ABQ9JC69_9CUCU|nr:hypothetical protein NQ317_001838 [Molorchus minor]